MKSEVKSESNLPVFEKYQEDLQRYSNISGLISMVIIIALAYYPEINNHYAKYWNRIDVFSLPVKGIVLIIGFSIVYFLTSHIREAIAEYGKYKNYCSSELLVVDSEKIIGSTIEGEFKWYLNQIQAVQIIRGSIPEDKRLKQLEVMTLIITDTSGDKLQFYSFSNCKELKHQIDELIAVN